MLKERQRTFTLKKCIARYGKDEGKRIFYERQEKWQKTLKSKPIEEIERINRSKFKNTGYSEISQELFNNIVKEIGKNYHEIYYATNSDSCVFNEYMVHDASSGKNYFLDFYIKDNNAVIEFDGDYWHSEKITGKIEQDAQREEELRQLGYTNIFRIKECDYRNDPDGTTKKCVEFIRGLK